MSGICEKLCSNHDTSHSPQARGSPGAYSDPNMFIKAPKIPSTSTTKLNTDDLTKMTTGAGAMAQPIFILTQRAHNKWSSVKQKTMNAIFRHLYLYFHHLYFHSNTEGSRPGQDSSQIPGPGASFGTEHLPACRAPSCLHLSAYRTPTCLQDTYLLAEHLPALQAQDQSVTLSTTWCTQVWHVSQGSKVESGGGMRFHLQHITTVCECNNKAMQPPARPEPNNYSSMEVREEREEVILFQRCKGQYLLWFYYN